jgi:uncharacterized repeat protein (TIGR03803 family)
MDRKNVSVVVVMVCLALIPQWSFAASANGQVQDQYQILHSFGGPGDGSGPTGRLILDGRGNLYGTTLLGGVNAFGTVFMLSPGTNGQWTETILYSFPNSQEDGYWPAGVVMDSAGNLYGTTTRGGLNASGIVYELTPGPNGQWTETILYNFCSLPDCADGDEPLYAPTVNPNGGLYGVTGTTAYDLTSGSNGWTFSVLYKFCSQPNCSDGSLPTGSLILDTKGNLYGETEFGGTGTDCGGAGCGTAFALRPGLTLPWKEIVLHDFQGASPDGVNPNGGVSLYENALFGTTGAGGGINCAESGNGCGTVFQITEGSGADINEQILHAFGASLGLGYFPLGDVIFDKRGDLFGLTADGGTPSCKCGVVFGMKREGDGKWAYAVLHAFDGSDGVLPVYGLTIDNEDNLYGITNGGGPPPGGGGVAFELSPVKQAN